MSHNFFYLPKVHRWAYLLGIFMFVFLSAYLMFPWMIKAQFGNSIPPYVQYDLIYQSRDIFWVFENLVFLLNCWIFSWTRLPRAKYFFASLVFVLGWFITIIDFRAPSQAIIWGTGLLCALYYLLLLGAQQIDKQFVKSGSDE